jgi:hypothetical protein
MLIHFYVTPTEVVLYDGPRPEPSPGVYRGTLDLTEGELELLRQIADDHRVRHVEN